MGSSYSKILFIFFMVMLSLILTGTTGQVKEPSINESEQLPSLISAIKINKPLDFCGEPVPLDNQDVRERFEREFMTSLWNRPQVILWLKRSGRYMPHIEEMLKKNGMPGDLKYLVIVESALRAHAGSPKGAMGYWQFMESTGENYGLTVNNDIDERRNIFTSTNAAIRYLKKIHEIFGSWTLAAAAYNMGEEGLKSEILIQKMADYYKLYLPLETQRYIFRIISAKLILSEPGKYGFAVAKGDLYPPLDIDSVELTCSEDTPLYIIAQAAKTHFKAIKDLNPEIRGYYLSKGHHILAIPKGAAGGFHALYEKLFNQWLADRKKSVYIVKNGDSLYSLASRFNVPLPSLLIWNRLSKVRKLTRGEKLIIYSDSDSVSPGKTGQD